MFRVFCDHKYESAVSMAIKLINISSNFIISFNLKQTHNRITHSEHGFSDGVTAAYPTPDGGIDISKNKVCLATGWGNDIDYLENKK